MDGGTHIPFILQDYVQVCSQGQNKFPLNDHEMYVGRRQSCQSAKVQPNYSKAAAIISASEASRLHLNCYSEARLLGTQLGLYTN